MAFFWKKAALPLLVWMLNGAVGTEGRILQEEERVRTDLVRLIPFDVQIALTGPVEDVNIYALTDIVTDWMTDSFVAKSGNEDLINNSTTFSSLGLELRGQQRRELQQSVEGVVPAGSPYNLFSATYEGVSLWERRGTGTTPMDPEIVELIQRATFVEDARLLNMLKQAEEFTGLGDLVFDVRAFVTPIATNPTTSTGGVSDNNLEIIIIIAIVVACLAFGLLMFAVIWAWRTDQSKRDAYKMTAERSLPRVEVPTGSDSDYNEKSPTGISPPAIATPEPQPPAEISQTPNNDYADSVISEDISTSLTAYYRSGMASYTSGGRTYSSSGTPAVTAPRELNDAASISSMDSYGYSLDGYAPSLGPAPQGYPVGPINGMIKDPDASYTDDEGTLSTKEGGADQSADQSVDQTTDSSQQ